VVVEAGPPAKTIGVVYHPDPIGPPVGRVRPQAGSERAQVSDDADSDR